MQDQDMSVLIKGANPREVHALEQNEHSDRNHLLDEFQNSLCWSEHIVNPETMSYVHKETMESKHGYTESHSTLF